NFNLFLKECEWRFNMGEPKLLLKDLKMILKQYY
ncbi:MAG: IS1595 family transposase, partial [Alphaproteobacteria bacterium]